MKKLLLLLLLTLSISAFSQRRVSTTTSNGARIATFDFYDAEDDGFYCINDFIIYNNRPHYNKFNFSIYINRVKIFTGWAQLYTNGSVVLKNRFNYCIHPDDNIYVKIH